MVKNPIAKNLNRNRPTVIPNKKKHKQQEELMYEDEETSDFALVTAVVKVQYKVVFNELLTEIEAKQAFWEDDFEEIIDDETLEIIGIESVKLLGEDD